MPFTKEQLEILQKLIGQTNTSFDPSLISSGNMAHQGTISLALLSHVNSTPWIVDSGASDHMTGNLNLFQSFTPCTDSHAVRIANGSCSR